MAKTIKRVGIIFFVLVVSLLVAVGSVFAVNVTSNGDMLLADTSNTATDNNSKNSENGISISAPDKIIELGGNSNQMANGWRQAIKDSANGQHIKVVLLNDWVAMDSEKYTKSFIADNEGDTTGFLSGSIFVRENSHITLDLNGKTIDRGLAKRGADGVLTYSVVENGCVFYCLGTLDIVDSSYDSDLLNYIYKEADSIEATAIRNKIGKYGKIIGGGNSVRIAGGGIHVTGLGVVNYYGGVITDNFAGCGGGICVLSSATLNMYNGIIFANAVSDNAGGIYTSGSTNVMFYDGAVVFNDGQTTGGIRLTGLPDFRMYNGIILGNTSKNSNFGSAMTYSGVKNVEFRGGLITRNKHLSNGHAIMFDAGVARVAIYSGFQIYGNKQYSSTVEKGESDFYLQNNKKLEICEPLDANNKITRIGIDLADDYLGAFTYGYRVNATVAPSRFFFSNKGKKIELNGYEAIVSEEDSTATTIEWRWDEGNGEQPMGKSSSAIVPYTGSWYKVLIGNGIKIFKQGETESKDSFMVTDAGTYVFYVEGDYTIPTFMLTILPKEVNIVWGSTQLTYNGKVQMPTASIKEDTSCKVTVGGSGINVGVGYMATVTDLSNKNYTIKYNTQNIAYSIVKAKVTSPTGTQNYILDGKEHTFLPENFNESLMQITGNVGQSAGEYTATISLLDSSNYEWQSGGTNAITLKYTIEDKSMIKDGVYDYLYLESNGNSVVRKSYSQNGVYRVANDTDLIANNNNGKLIMGNILPETSVSEFMSNLYFEQDKLQVYNNKGEEITDTNANVGSGWKIVYDGTEEIYLSVLGDVTGDGRIDATDITYLRRVANGEVSDLSIAVQLAAMVDNRGKITSVDAEILRAVCKYEITIDMYF